MGEYSEAAVEVLDILSNTNKYEFQKIPQSFINYLRNISSNNYKVNFDHTKPVDELNIKAETRELLGFIYITWWCSEDDKKEYKKIIQDNKISNSKKTYISENIFNIPKNDLNKNIISNENINKANIIKYEKRNPFECFYNKIVGLFRK